MVGSFMNLNALLSPERRTPQAMALVFLPWLAVVLWTAGPWAALIFLVYAIMVFAAGYAIVCAALPAADRIQTFVLSPAAGILAISAFTAFWVRLGLALAWVAIPWLGLMAAGAVYLWRDRALWSKSTVAYGGALVLLSVVISGVYLLPMARNDAVLRRDGSYNWIYMDTQFNFAIAASVKSSGSPPSEPGSAVAGLFYHFGPYAPAAALSRLAGVDLGDAFARVTRGAALWALVLSCFGLGVLLSLKANGGKFGGVMSVAGFFFYGALLSLFTDERNSSSYVTGAILFKIPGVEVRSDGGPFSHLILGHSTLHAMGAMTAIMGLCLVQRDRGEVPIRKRLVLLLLPALAVAVHSAGSLYCLGIVAILLFWGRLGNVGSWLSIVAMSFLYFVAWKIMGYSHAPDALRAAIRLEPSLRWLWFFLLIWFTIGLGFRILGFRWISKTWRDPLSALVLATSLGWLLFFLFVQFKHYEQIYGLIYLQCLLSIFAFSRLSPMFWRSGERMNWVAEWLRLAAAGLGVFVAAAVLGRVALHFMHSSKGIASFRLHIIPCGIAILLLAGTAALMKRSRRFAEISSAMIMAVLAVGFLAWIAPWLNFGLGRMKMDITLSPGEVQGLTRLNHLAAPGERFATNRHAVDSIATGRERSYGYMSVAERPVLLEGYLYHNDTDAPAFKALLRDNDSMFTTTDPATLLSLAKAWRVRWLVARPGTDVALPKPLPSWLIEQQNCGDLKVYRIDQ
jgi:hypothetical protein